MQVAAPSSEGLNLQTCGVLINYDMPWNPMRVEQRLDGVLCESRPDRVVWAALVLTTA